MVSSDCSRLWRLCRLCRLCKLCKLLDVRRWLVTGLLTDVLSSVLPDVLFGVLLLFDARLWRIVEHRKEVLGERLLVDHCVNHCGGFLCKGSWAGWLRLRRPPRVLLQVS